MPRVPPGKGPPQLRHRQRRLLGALRQLESAELSLIAASHLITNPEAFRPDTVLIRALSSLHRDQAGRLGIIPPDAIMPHVPRGQRNPLDS